MSELLGPKPPPRGDDLPCDDGEPLETARHREQMILLIHTLRDAWRDRHDFYVSGNMFVYYSETQARRYDYRGPDVFVVLDTDDRERRTWVVWEEGGRAPDVIIELVSESTEHIDRGPKMDIYARLLRTAVYVIFDPFSARLDVFRLDPVARRYVRIDEDDRGLVPCGPLGLSLGVRAGPYAGIEAPWLRWFDGEGVALPHEGERVEEAERRAEEQARRAEEQARRAEEQTRRADSAEAELARLREEARRR